jgi:hypothetical protein
MTDNEIADKKVANNEVVNDKSIDNEMTDDEMADDKISDNKTTEGITAEEKAMEEEKIEETSKDDEMTDAQHRDGESTEDEIMSLSVIRKQLFPHMPDLFFDMISKYDLGLPSQFHAPSAYEWLKKTTLKFHSNDKESTINFLTLQHACLRFHCVACRRPCQDVDKAAPIKGHSTLLFPCGHIIGDSCHDALVHNFKLFDMSPICP